MVTNANRHISMKLLAVVMAFFMAASLLVGLNAVTTKADTATQYTAPTEAKDTNDGYITGTAHRAASPILGMMGINAVAGFGMINGAAPADLAGASTSAAVGIWGSDLNDNPDPYYWNYFYNFYVDDYNTTHAAEIEAGTTKALVKADSALVNGNWSGSPMQADLTLNSEGGTVSGSLHARPDIAIGCGAKGSAESDTSGYDSQLATINGRTSADEYYQTGDETYAPQLVAYQRAHLTDMIATAYNIADAMEAVTKATGKVGRYGSGQTIAEEYESYIYGLQAYILKEINTNENVNKKTVAIVTAYDTTTGTFTIADASTQEATSTNRYVEYTDIVCDNIATTKGTTVTASDIAATDVVILSNYNSEAFTDASGQASTMQKYLSEQTGYNAKQIIIENYPSALYGITMNSVENAMGMAYVVAYAYCDVIDIDPVSVCAYYYQKFYHISSLDNLETAVEINFKSTTLPEGYSNTLPADYSADKVEGMINEGKIYYQSDSAAFANTYIAKAGWEATVDQETMYRLYNPNTGEHLYTASEKEVSDLTVLGWQYEDVAWVAPSTSTTPVYRLYNPNNGDHHYTVDLKEKEWLVGLGWNDEGIAWYSGGDVAVYRLFNPNATQATHHYTGFAAERDWLEGMGWNNENVAWYALSIPEK